MLLLLYVDDMIITGDDISGISDLKHFLNQNFLMKDLGVLNYFLGLEIGSSVDGYTLSQAKYASDLLSRAELTDSKTAPTPLEPNVKLTPFDGSPLPNVTLYRQLVGSLVYLTVTLPEIAYAVFGSAGYRTSVSQPPMQKPTRNHVGQKARPGAQRNVNVQSNNYNYSVSNSSSHGSQKKIARPATHHFTSNSAARNSTSGSHEFQQRNVILNQTHVGVANGFGHAAGRSHYQGSALAGHVGGTNSYPSTNFKSGSGSGGSYGYEESYDDSEYSGNYSRGNDTDTYDHGGAYADEGETLGFSNLNIGDNDDSVYYNGGEDRGNDPEDSNYYASDDRNGTYGDQDDYGNSTYGGDDGYENDGDYGGGDDDYGDSGEYGNNNDENDDSYN
ncbi:hypothetical protein RJ639_024526 [Escallonia herrerae]|uniref:Reverse transcriptase Ty1/copia-type domain-containing protein n=1 Tax=Escallonia herrerae TaxID=1293975 RepID=A0AA88V1F7_9ASTE|nr:hypothetical protein RJ639_024526 [Escallonia herrerae]